MLRAFASFIVLSSATGFAEPRIKTMISIDLEQKAPADWSFAEEMEVGSGLTDSLVSARSSDELLGPGMATSWQYDAREGVIRFHLRDDLKFSDGAVIDARVVRENLRRLREKDEAKQGVLDTCITGKDSSWVTAVSATELTVSVTSQACVTSVLYRLKSINAGIVQPDAPKGPPFSGRFSLTREGGQVVLRPNPHHYAWNAIEPSARPALVFETQADPTQRLAAIAEGSLDVFKTFRDAELNAAKRGGYRVRYSLPVMTWYLVPLKSEYPKGSVKVEATLDDINRRIDRNKVLGQGSEKLETEASTFFPESLGCGGEGLGKPKAGPRFAAIHLIEHRSGESKVFSQGLAKELERLGYKVDVGARPTQGALNLEIQRFHLGANLLRLFELLLVTFDDFPDPDGSLHKALVRFRAGGGNGADEKRDLCARFSNHYHVPLAHRHYAFLAKDERLLDLYSRDEGMMWPSRLPEIISARSKK